jgi:hypothetical protein
VSHEDLSRTHAVESSSNRSFGLVFAAVFAIVALWPLPWGGAVRWWSLAVAAGFLVLALAIPSVLAVPNRLWLRFGLLLNRIVSPLVLGIVFFLVVTPMGIAMRLLGKDPLRLKAAAPGASYWIRRDPPGPSPDSLTNQF